MKEVNQIRRHFLTIQILKLMTQTSNPDDGKLPFRFRIFVGLRLEILGHGEFFLEARVFLWRPNWSYQTLNVGDAQRFFARIFNERVVEPEYYLPR